MNYPYFKRFDLMDYQTRSAVTYGTALLDMDLFGSTSGTTLINLDLFGSTSGTVLTSICSKHQTPDPDCKMCKPIFHLTDKRK